MKPKLIIFDLDGTLYDLMDVHGANYLLQVRFVQQHMDLPEADAKQLLSDNGIYPIITNESKSATELFARLGLNMGDWKLYRESYFDASDIDKSKAISEETIKGFAQICPLVLLSSNSLQNILKTLNYLGINNKLFNTIFCSDNTPTDAPFNKKQAMQIIAKKYKVEYNDIVSIGDRYQTDVIPILELGGHGIVVDMPIALRTVLADFMKGEVSSNGEYSVF